MRVSRKHEYETASKDVTSSGQHVADNNVAGDSCLLSRTSVTSIMAMGARQFEGYAPALAGLF